jgi:hypothetical protein
MKLFHRHRWTTHQLGRPAGCINGALFVADDGRTCSPNFFYTDYWLWHECATCGKIRPGSVYEYNGSSSILTFHPLPQDEKPDAE